MSKLSKRRRLLQIMLHENPSQFACCKLYFSYHLIFQKAQRISVITNITIVTICMLQTNIIKSDNEIFWNYLKVSKLEDPVFQDASSVEPIWNMIISVHIHWIPKAPWHSYRTPNMHFWPGQFVECLVNSVVTKSWWGFLNPKAQAEDEPHVQCHFFSWCRRTTISKYFQVVLLVAKFVKS